MFFCHIKPGIKLKVNVGVIGVGNQGTRHLDKYILIPEKAKIVAVSDVNKSAAEDAAKKYGAEAWYTDYKKLLQRSDIDAVSICVPNNLHADIAIASAEAGKHILLEKPIALTLKEADAIIDEADKAKVKLMIGYNHLFNPMIRHTKKLIEDGQLGKLSIVKTQYLSNFVARIKTRSDFGWRADVKQVGGGVLMESGVHRISLSRYLGGEVDKVCAFTERLAMDIDGEDNAVIILTYEGGGLGTVICSWVSEFKGPEWEKIEVYGTKGSVIGYGNTRSGVAYMEFSSKDLPDYGRLHSYFPPDIFRGGKGYDTYKDVNEHFIDCIIKDAKPVVDGYDGRAILEITLAAYESAKAQKIVQLPL